MHKLIAVVETRYYRNIQNERSRKETTLAVTFTGLFT
jgi:hypothetical protein